MQKRSREQKEGPHEREGGLKPSIEIWQGFGELVAVNLAREAWKWVERLRV